MKNVKKLSNMKIFNNYSVDVLNAWTKMEKIIMAMQ